MVRPNSRLRAGFTAEAFEVVGVDAKPVRLTLLNSWRFWSLLISNFRFSIFMSLLPAIIVNFPVIIIEIILCWLAIRGSFKLIYWTGITRQDLGQGLFSWLWLMATIRFLRTITKLNNKASPRENTIWWGFWFYYMQCTFDRRRFAQNYLAAWRKENPHHVLTLFINNGLRIDIPYPDPVDIDDEVILKHLRLFYGLNLFQEGIIRALIPKTLSSVDIVELVRGQAAGRPVETLDLGFDGYRQILDFEYPSGLKGFTTIGDKLRTQGVYRCVRDDCKCGQRQNALEAQGGTVRCLNMVLGWNANAASIIILTPTILSIVITIAWPAVAVQVYGQDVQTSVQTGGSVASYVVTAGALLIALVTWYDQISAVKPSAG